MHFLRLIAIFLSIASSFFTTYTINLTQLLKEDVDLQFNINGRYKPEVFWGDNLSLLNRNNAVNCRPLDRIFYARHTFDLNFNVQHGQKKYEKTVLEFMCGIRNKYIWGNPESTASTTEVEVKVIDALLGSHRHSIPLILRMREIWLKMTLGKPIGLDFDCDHTLTLGLFPFQLGRGIALGDAYATGPEILGFYSESIVDQYAPGARLSGCILPKCLSYDLYAAILNNKSSTLGETGAKIFGQECGRRLCPQRGFGDINYVIAGRLKWQVFNNQNLGSFEVEPYWLFNEDPEQRVQFLADAHGKLGTLGVAGEYLGKCWEFGFDYAFNLGHQRVKCWDRNRIELQNRDGNPTLVNSHVFVNADPNGNNVPSSLEPYKAVHSPDITITPPPAQTLSPVGKNAQKLINNVPQAEQFNGKFIGSVPGYTAALENVPVAVQPGVDNDQFYNSRTRFRDAYTNKYKGWMIVADAAWWVVEKDVKLAVTGGAASGDENPNEETIDGDFTGFIPLQDIYSGKRVKSAFVMGGAGKLKRPLSAPEDEQAPNRFSAEVSQFTNLVFTGAALYWTPSDWTRKFSFNPNVIAYWQQHPTKKFDFATRKNLPENARTFLGTEVNSFIKYYVLPELNVYFVWSVFIPGGHYTDIRGKPLTADQEKALDAFNQTGFEESLVPNLGDDTAVTLNLGVEYTF